MVIKTKYNEGDKVFTIDTSTMKVKAFTVNRISTRTHKGETEVVLHDGDSFYMGGYDQDKCFPSEKELMDFITSNDEPETL